jgi:hypothetical protein
MGDGHAVHSGPGIIGIFWCFLSTYNVPGLVLHIFSFKAHSEAWTGSKVNVAGHQHPEQVFFLGSSVA